MHFIDTRCYYVYILTNQNKTVLYTRVTNSLQQRVTEHYKVGLKTFAGKYNTYWLLYFEATKYIKNAIAREKEIKGWSRQKKMDLINTMNPELKFLNEEVFGKWPPEEIVHR